MFYVRRDQQYYKVHQNCTSQSVTMQTDITSDIKTPDIIKHSLQYFYHPGEKETLFRFIQTSNSLQ